MKKINFRKINVFISALLALSLSLASCSSEIEDDSGKDKDTAYLKINVAADSRTILPDFDVTAMEYTLYGKLDGGEKRTLATFPDYKSLQTDIISLESGNWEFELEGVSYTSVNLPDDFSYGYINGTYYDRDNLNSRTFGSVFSGFVEKAIQKGTNDVSFVLSLKSDYTSSDSYYYDLQGNYHSWENIKFGSVDVTLNLPSDSMVYVKASLNSLDEGSGPVSVTENLTVQNSSVSFKKDDVNCGYYELIFEFYDDQDYQVKLNTYKEVVKVVAGCTSRAEIIIPLLNDYKDFNIVGFELHGGQFASGYYPLENFVPNQKTKLPNALQVVHDGGYVLEGFYDNAEYTGKRYTELEGFAEDVTMHAKWVKGIAVTSDKVKDLNLSTITEPQALVCFGEMTSDIKAAIEKAANFIDLILVDTKTFVSFNDDYWSEEILPKLRSVVIPNGVTEIGYAAFRGCTNLASITIPSSVIKIGERAFDYCGKLNKLYLEDINSYLKIEFVSSPFASSSGPNRIYVNNVEVTDIAIPEGVNVIASAVFNRCSNLASITIPSSVTVIGEYVFYGCSNLASITIPSSVTEIGWSAFYGCSKLSNLHLEDISSYLSIEFEDSSSWPFNSSTGPNKIYVNNVEVTDLVIPDGFEEISPYAFQGCIFNSIVLPSTVTEINSNTLSGLSFTSITIPSSVTVIGDNAFYGHSSLASITIPSSVTYIGDWAFYGCNSLASITIPSLVTRIGECAFYECSSLVSITIPSSVTEIGWNAFEGCDNIDTIWVDDMDSYNNISGDRPYSGTVKVKTN